MLGDTWLAARKVSFDTLHGSVRANRNGNKHAMAPTRQGVLMAVDASVAAANASAAPVADVARGAVNLLLLILHGGLCSPLLLMMMLLMASAVTLVASTATASAPTSSLAAGPLAVVWRLYARGQGMGASGTSVPYPGILDPCQGFPQFIRLHVCHEKTHFIFNIKNMREGHSGFEG